MAVIQCRYFSGYKPCGRSGRCDEGCPEKEVIQSRILLIHLGALGAVVRSTALLAGLRRKYPRSHITWVTQKPADQLLTAHPGVDRVLSTAEPDLLQLRALHFDAAFVVDKSLIACGVLAMTKADFVYGFRADARTGALLPASPAAEELWRIGLSDELKFFVNRKPEIQLVFEALELGEWRNDDYSLPLTAEEGSLRSERRALWSGAGRKKLIGLNTGCGAVMPAKKWTVETHRELVLRLGEDPGLRVVLLGGPEDSERNESIARGLDVIVSPTRSGLRDGLVSVSACDVVVTGDSLGMHLAISQKIPVLAWFGPTCGHEIELYGRGRRIVSDFACSPCWKRSCSKERMCYDGVDLDVVLRELRGILSESSKRTPPCPEMDTSTF